MLEITNRTSGPIQLVIRSKKKARAFTTLVVPGRGRSKNVVLLEDERKTEYVDRAVNAGFISVRELGNK